MASLITPEQRALLLAHGTELYCNPDFDPPPIVKLFTPDAGGIWLLAALTPECPDKAFGLCDLGVGSPEIGTVSLREIERLRGRFGLPVERDAGFIGIKPLSAYARNAQRVGFIVPL